MDGVAGAPPSAGVGGGTSGAGGDVGGTASGSGGDTGGAASGSGGEVGGAPNGGTGGTTVEGGAAGQGNGGAGSGGQVSCWNWDQVTNQPKPGETGLRACPGFDELEFVKHQNCVLRATPNEPVEPVPGQASGDCCYNITYVWCR